MKNSPLILTSAPCPEFARAIAGRLGASIEVIDLSSALGGGTVAATGFLRVEEEDSLRRALHQSFRVCVIKSVSYWNIRDLVAAKALVMLVRECDFSGRVDLAVPCISYPKAQQYIASIRSKTDLEVSGPPVSRLACRFLGLDAVSSLFTIDAAADVREECGEKLVSVDTAVEAAQIVAAGPGVDRVVALDPDSVSLACRVSRILGLGDAALGNENEGLPRCGHALGVIRHLRDLRWQAAALLPQPDLKLTLYAPHVDLEDGTAVEWSSQVVHVICTTSFEFSRADYTPRVTLLRTDELLWSAMSRHWVE